jgi:hypothetical protein
VVLGEHFQRFYQIPAHHVSQGSLIELPQVLLRDLTAGIAVIVRTDDDVPVLDFALVYPILSGMSKRGSGPNGCLVIHHRTLFSAK